MESKTMNDDERGEVLGLLGGGGILLMQAAAVIPGLLPILLLAGAFALPLVVLGLAAGVLVGVPFGLWQLTKWLVSSVHMPKRGDRGSIRSRDSLGAVPTGHEPAGFTGRGVV